MAAGRSGSRTAGYVLRYVLARIIWQVLRGLGA